MKHTTSRQNFGDAPGQTPKFILTLCHMVQRLEIDTIDDISYGGRECLDEFANLVDHCQTIRVQHIWVNDPLDDWSKREHSAVQKYHCSVSIPQEIECLLGRHFGTRRKWHQLKERICELYGISLKTTGKCTPGSVMNGMVTHVPPMGDADWKRFERLLDMSDNELTARGDEWLTRENRGYDEGDGTDDAAEEQEGEEDEEDSEAEEGGRYEEDD